MVKTEYYATRNDGVVLVKSYSDINHYIISDETGAEYTEAIDPEEMHRTYTESEKEIEEREELPEPDLV